MMKNHLCFSMLLMSLISITYSNASAADVEAGRRISTQCAICHGETGGGNGAPRSKISGMEIDHFIKCVNEYRSGIRRNVMMERFTRNLNDKDIENLAAYYATQ